MFRRQFSLRSSLGLTICLMGMLGMVLALVAAELYRRHAVETYRGALVELVKLKTSDLVAVNDDRSRDLGLSIQTSPDFSQLVKLRKREKIEALLDSQFHQYFVTTGVVSLEKLFVYDPSFRLIAGSNEGRADFSNGTFVCPDLIKEAAARSGADRLKVVSNLCVYDQKPYWSVLVPVGGIRVYGYVQVISDASHGLLAIENALGMPVRVVSANGDVTAQSESWPTKTDSRHHLVIDYALHTANQQTALTLSVVANVNGFYGGLTKVRLQVMAVAAGITVIAVFIALLLFQRSTISPLRILTQQLQLLRRDRSHLGEHVSVGGNLELRELASNFNKMTSELSNLYSKLESIAYIDPVTKLANRTRFHDLLFEHAERAVAGTEPFALLIIDVDRFKAVNDSLGHEVGDQLLVQVGVRLEQILRKSDVMARLDSDAIANLVEQNVSTARLGGDEFAAILPGLRSDNEASIVAQKIMGTMQTPFVLDGKSFNINVSIGIVLAPQHGTDASTLLRRADVTVAEAKQYQCGYQLYNRSKDQHRLFQLTLERELREAIESDALELYFQPQLETRTGKPWGAEALVRWKHGVRGFISPDQFIPLAEQSGLIHPLTVWVLNQALKQCAQWQSTGYSLNVAVNLSARSLQVKELPELVFSALEQWRMPPAKLCLEITESAVMADPASALKILSRLDAMGVHLSIDDFGTGYSSMSYLKQMPVDEIKIDRSFVMEMAGELNDAVIVRSIVDLAHNMGLRAVAEGVESEAVWRALVNMGCDLSQGFYFAKPMPAQAFLQWLVSTAPSWESRSAASASSR